jgi:hypothetical protein
MNGRPKTESKADPRRTAPLGQAAPNQATQTHVTQEELAQIGEGEVAYLKLMMSEDIRRAFPQAPELAPGLKLFALLSADGTPILLADSKAAALANAWEHELETVSLH